MIEILNSFFKRGFGTELADSEHLISERKIHWGILFPSLGIFILWIYLRMKAQSYSVLGFIPTQLMERLPAQAQDFIQNNIGGIYINPVKWLSTLVLLYGCWRLYKALVTLFTTLIYSTQHRLFVQTGLIKNQQVEILWAQVDAFQISKGIIGRFLNYGTITIHCVGGMTTRLPAVKDPDQLHTQIIALRFNQA